MWVLSSILFSSACMHSNLPVHLSFGDMLRFCRWSDV
jgi:hypothetical protein